MRESNHIRIPRHQSNLWLPCSQSLNFSHTRNQLPEPSSALPDMVWCTWAICKRDSQSRKADFCFLSKAEVYEYVLGWIKVMGFYLGNGAYLHVDHVISDTSDKAEGIFSNTLTQSQSSSVVFSLILSRLILVFRNHHLIFDFIAVSEFSGSRSSQIS
jgi:hypothetical protein